MQTCHALCSVVLLLWVNCFDVQVFIFNPSITEIKAKQIQIKSSLTVCSPPCCYDMLCILHDSPWYTAKAPGLQFINDLRLQHNRLPGSYFLPQQISHSSGELWLGLNDLWGLFVHYKRAEGVNSNMSDEEEREKFVRKKNFLSQFNY